MQDKTPHILVIDDDWMNREVLEAYLTAEKYRVTTAHSGQKGIDLALADPPDLILLDAVLPDLAGFEVCTRMKRSEKLRFVPVVFVTALESDADKLRAVEAGVAVLAGPFEGYGPTVVVSHGGGYYSLYLYLRDLSVREGDTVGRGQVVGRVGGSRTPEGPHIEFQIRSPGGEAVDPLGWLRRRVPA